jgi:hypothetical protein
VDTLLKKEFDAHRRAGTKHPLMEHYNIEAVPIAHEDLDDWRQNFTGIQVLHEPTNFIVFGAIDDLWQNEEGEYVVVDYKATSKSGKIEALDQDWHDGYKRQMEIYQWLLRQRGYDVSDTGYFVYANGDTDKEAFDARLEFDVTVISYDGNDEWVEQAILEAKDIMDGDDIPAASRDCDYCTFFNERSKVEKKKPKTTNKKETTPQQEALL